MISRLISLIALLFAAIAIAPAYAGTIVCAVSEVETQVSAGLGADSNYSAWETEIPPRQLGDSSGSDMGTPPSPNSPGVAYAALLAGHEQLDDLTSSSLTASFAFFVPDSNLVGLLRPPRTEW